MFGRKQSRAERARHDARSLAMRGVERASHRAEALREALPEPGDLLSDLRDQAEPMLKAAREQADKAPVPQRKRSRSKKPFLFLGLAVVGAVVAYLIFSKRDKEPAYLMEEPDAPEGSPAERTTPGMGQNGSSPEQSPSDVPAQANGEDVPERASAYMAQEPAQPTQASSSSGGPGPFASSDAPGFGPASASYQPRAQVAAWDLPPSSIPPMRGRTSL